LPYQASRHNPGADLHCGKFTTGRAEYIDIQEISIKQAVEKITLPTHMQLHESRTGIKRED